MSILNIVKTTCNATIPTRATIQSAGLDLYSAYHYCIEPNGNACIQTDLQMDIPRGYYGRIAERSGLALKKRIIVGGGVIDSDYRGNIGVILHNFGPENFVVNVGDRIAQIICEKIAYPLLIVECETLDSTDRGDSGFGSSGISTSIPTTQFKKQRIVRCRKNGVSNIDDNEDELSTFKNSTVIGDSIYYYDDNFFEVFDNNNNSVENVKSRKFVQEPKTENTVNANEYKKQKTITNVVDSLPNMDILHEISSPNLICIIDTIDKFDDFKKTDKINTIEYDDITQDAVEKSSESNIQESSNYIFEDSQKTVVLDDIETGDNIQENVEEPIEHGLLESNVKSGVLDIGEQNETCI